MSEIKDIQQKYLRLVEIYADKNLANDSDEAKQISAELATESIQDYNTAVRLAKGALSPTQKFAAQNAERAITAARRNTAASPTTENQATAPTPPKVVPTVAKRNPTNTPQPLESEEDKQTKPKPRKTAENDTKKNQTQRYELPENIAKDLNEYIYTNADDYSDNIADYIDAKGLPPREKISHALNIIDYLRDEFRKRPDKSQPNPPRADRKKLMFLTLTLRDENPQNNQVEKKAKGLFTRLSNVAQNDYAKRIQRGDAKPARDNFLENMIAMRTPDNAEYLGEFVEAHIDGMFAKLEKQEDKLKYARLLNKKHLSDFIPEELAEALNRNQQQNSDKPKKQSKEEKNQPTKGDRTMTDEVKDTEGSVTDTDTKKDKEEVMFNPSGIQKWACLYANEDYKKFKNEQELLDALSNKGVMIQGNNVIDLNMESVVHTFSPKTEEEVKAQEAKKYAERDDGLDPSDLPSPKKPITINPRTTDETEKEKEPKPEEPEQPLDWVQKKIRDYKAMEAEGKISNVVINEELKTEFEAQVEGGTVHYSSPDNVSISNDAKIKTFEAVMMEPDNVGRPINFGENMPHDMAIRLAAACVLHGNKMIGNVPELSAEDMNLLKAELGDRFEDFQKKYAEQTKSKEERTGEEKPAEEKPAEERPAEEKPAEEKAKLSTAEELGKAAESLKGIKEQFEQMKSEGLIAVTTNIETKKPEIVAGPALEGKPEDEQKKVVESANALIASAAAIVQSSKTVSGKLNEEQAKQNNEFNRERLNHIRQTMDQKKLAEHDAMTPEARAARLAERRKDMSEKLGITADPKGENKPLAGKDLEDFIAQSKVTVKNYADMWQAAHEGQKFDIKSLKPEEKEVFMQISKTQLARTNALKGNDHTK